MVDLEKLDNLPQRISIRRDVVNIYGNIWSNRLDYHSNEHGLSILASRVLENNIGKSLDGAFKYYKKKSKYFHNSYDADYYFFKELYPRQQNKYYIDSLGSIQYSKEYLERRKRDKSISITSKDFKIEGIHKETKHSFDMFEECWTKKEVTKTWETNLGSIRSYTYKERDNFLGFRYKGKYYMAYKDDFELVITQGWKKTFSSKRDPNYKRLLADISKPKSKNKPKKMSEQQFREILNKGKIKEKEKNDIIMIKHGFDPKTSFRYGQ